MTHSQQLKCYNDINRTFDTGKFPRGITTPCEFYELVRLYNAYVEKKQTDTIMNNVVKTLARYGIPCKVKGIGFTLEF